MVEKLEDRTLLSGSPLATLTLQQGANNYTGASNAWINGSAGQTTANSSGTETLFVNGASGSEMDSLLRWDVSSLNSAATIQSATVSLNIEDSSGNGPYTLYAVNRSWDPGTVNFNQAGASNAWQVPGAHGSADAGTTALGSFSPTSDGIATITLNAAGIAVIQSWVNNPAMNDGFILRSASGELEMSSNLDTAPATRPALALSYSMPPLVVNAGPNASVTQTSVLSLQGSVIDSDPAATQAVASTWSMVSGPGTVTFENASSPTSDAIFSTVGTYVLQLSATDGTMSGSSQVTITVQSPAPELAPIVNAGSNQTITLNQTAALAGQVSQPGSLTVTSQWSQLSGPGTAIFTNATSPITTVQFTSTGTYVLDLVATDGTLAANSTVTITVNPAGTTAPVAPPVVSAGNNQSITLPATATLSGSVTYTTVAGATLSTVWQLASGPGTVTFGNSASPQTTATFSSAGIYYLRLLATYDGVSDQSYTTISVSSAASNVSFPLQQGTNSYAGGTSTYVANTATTTNYSTATADVTQGSGVDETLLSFNLAGTGVTGTVQSVTLQVDVTTAASSTYNVYALTRAWTASQATYNNATSTTTWQTPGALGATDYNSTLIGTLSSPTAGLNTITLNSTGISVVQGWINNPSTNYGLVIHGIAGTLKIQPPALDIDSDAFATAADRPLLNITSLVPAQPAQLPTVTNPVTSATAAVNGTGGVPGYLAGVGINLATLYYQYLQYQQSGSTSGFTPNLSQAGINAADISGSNVSIYVTSESTTVSQLTANLKSLGMNVTVASGNVIGGWLPISQIVNAALTHGLVTAIPATVGLTNDVLVGDVASPGATSSVVAPIDPAQMRTAYGINLLSDSGAGQTIAIVDAYNDPTIITDANAFSTQFGLPTFNATGGPTLSVLNQTGGTSLPTNASAGTGEWDVEEALDVEWAHSIAPNANIILFEANSASTDDLFQAVTTAAATPGVSAVSMSFGGAEFQGENSLDSVFTTPTGHQGVTFLAATGDDAAPSGYPAYSPNVVAVGGTTLNINVNGSYVSESGWSDGAGGISNFEPIPGYQIGKINGTSSTNRANPDVSMDADPNTGVFVVDSFLTGSTSQDIQVGGTSLATPMWAGLIALTNQVRASANESSLDGPSQTLPRLYQLPSSDFHDITTGNNGFPAGPGYDLVTGIGTPVANLLIPGLAGVNQAAGPSVSLAIQGNPISENGGQATITATLSAATTSAVTIQLQFTGTATFGTQYSVSGTQIVIPAGQTTGSVTVTGINTNQNIGNQTIVITAASVQGGTLAGGSQSVTLIELENESPQVTLTTSGGVGPGLNEFSETGGTATITATLTEPVSVPITIALGFSGDAILGTDYSASGQSITIAAGATSGSITLTGLSDTRTGASAAIYATIESITPSNVATTVVGSGTTTAYIVFPQISNPLPIISIGGNGPQISENGGQATITITRSSNYNGASAVQLIFNPNGTDTATLGTNYSVTDANGNPVGNDGYVFLDGLSTTITITGINNHLISPNLTFSIELGTAFDGVVSPSANEISGTIINTNTSTGVTLTSSTPVFTQNGGQMTITATLLQTFSQNAYVNLSFTGTAIANQDYTISNTANPSNPLQILIPAGSLTGSLVLTGSTANASDELYAAQDTVNVGIVSATNAVPINTQPVTAYLVSPTVPVVFSAQDVQVAEGGTASVQIKINQAMPFPVSVEYMTVNGSAVSGTNYTGQSTPLRITFAPGQTVQTIYIPTTDVVANATPATNNFYIELLGASLNAPTSAAPTGVGVEVVNNPSTGYAATVTMLNTEQVTSSAVGATSTLAGVSPPDPAGSEGNGDIAVMVSGLYNVFNTAGQTLLSETTARFWSNAGVALQGTPISTRMLFDTNVNRWIVVALDTNETGGVEQANNNILIAVSNTSSPNGSWTGFTLSSNVVTSGSAPSGTYGTSVQLGVDQSAANLTVNLSNNTESVISIPAVSLFPGTGKAPADTGYTALANVTFPSTNGQSELSIQPTTDLTGAEPTNELLGLDENNANTLDRFDIASEGSATVKATVNGPTLIPVSPSTFTQPGGAAQPGTSTTINTGTDAISATLYQVGDNVWAVQTVADPTTGNSDIQWFELSYSTNTILQRGVISDPNVSFYDASVAANAAGNVVIGFSGSGTNQYVSAYAVMGTTTGGSTTFTAPIMLQQGVADYNVPVTGITGTSTNSWGHYSETVPDGDNTPNTFWTFQEYASGPNQWSLGYFKVSFGVPTQTQPIVTLSSSSNSFNENGGTVTVTATLAAAASTTTVIDLGYSGSAVANLDYTISNPGTAAGNSPVQIVIPAGSTTGTVILTGASNPTAVGGESVDIAILTIDGSAPTTPSSVALTIANQSPPVITVENLTVTENGAATTADVVVNLSSASSNTVTVNYATASDGSAVANTDYTPETGTITFAPGTTQQTIAIPILVDGAAMGAENFLVNLTSPSGGTFPTGVTTESATVTLIEDDPKITIEDTSVVDTSPTTAQVTVVMSQPVAGPVSVSFQTTGGTAVPNVNYIPENNVVTFAAGQTTQTINIPILGDTGQNQTESFFVDLSNPSLGTIVRNQATVTLFNVQPGSLPPDQFDTASGETNFTADTSASGPFAPANPSGAVGGNDIVVFDSDQFQAFNKSTGTVLQSSTLNQFWTNAGLTFPAGDYVGQPHVVYDPSTGRWFASALDESVPPGSDGPAVLQNSILLAVSKTSDPTQGWVGFEFATDPNNTGVRADFDELGFNASSVVVTANMYNITTGSPAAFAVLSVPKADLTGASPTVARATLTTTLSTSSYTSVDPAVDYDASGNEYMLGESTGGPVIETVTGGGGPTASVTTAVSVGNATSTGIITASPIAAPQPAGAAPLTTGPGVQISGTSNGTGAQLDGLSSNFTGTIAQIDGHLWAAQTIYDSATKTDAIQWFEIDVTPTDPTYEKIIQHGVISDSSLFYYYPSLSVDSVGDVVIGFSGSSLTQQISSYAAYGTTTGTVTTFTSPILLKQGTGIYAGFSEANVASASISASLSTFNSNGNDTTTITVQLAAPAGSAGAVVDLGFSGTALANRDYSITAGTNAVVNAVGAPVELLIPAGQTNGTIVLTGLGNTAATGDETLNVSVTSINGTPPASTTSSSLTLLDNTSTSRAPGGMPLVSIENLVAVESSSSTAQVIVRLSEPVSTNMTVAYQTQDGTAVAGTDYTATSGTLTFTAGQTVATINVPLINDGTEEGKTFSVDLSANSRGTLMLSSATVTLLTTNPTASPGPSVTLSGGGSFSESSDIPATITATLSIPAPAEGTLINLSFGGTATFGTDYVASGETIYIAPGQSSGSITLLSNDVPIGGSALSVVVGITSVEGGFQSSTQTATATLNPGNIASASITGQVTVPLSSLNNTFEPLAGITVYLTTDTPPFTGYGTDGDFNPAINLFTTTDANGNYSFTGLPAGSYTVRELIPSNYLVTSPTGDSQTVNLAQAATTAVNFQNSLTAVWGAYSATALDPSNPGVFWTFQGFDDDQSGLDFDTWGVQATQLAVTNFTSDTNVPDAEQFNIPVTLTASSSLVSTSSLDTITATIPAQTSPTTIYIGFSGTAEGNLDYYVLPNASTDSWFTTGAPLELIIPAGATTAKFSIEGGFGLSDSAETLGVYVDQINLATPGGTQPNGINSPLSLTEATPDFSIENGLGYETQTDAVVPVRLSNALPVAETVTYTTEQAPAGTGLGVAQAGPTGQYYASTGTVTFPAGATEENIEIPLTGNTFTGVDVFDVALTSTSTGTVVPPNPSTVYLMATQPTQNVGPAVNVAFSSLTFNSTGTGDTDTFTATLSAASTSPVVLQLMYSTPGTELPGGVISEAVEGQDFTTTGDVIVIPAGSTSGTVTVTGNNQNYGPFQIAINGFYGATAGTTATAATATITAPTTLAGGGGTIEGDVVDENGNPMAGVYVYLGFPLTNDVYQPNNDAYVANSIFAVTDKFGDYEFTGLPDASPVNNYTVSELVPANYVEANPTGDQYAVDISFSTTTGFTYKTNYVEGGVSVTDTSNFPIDTRFKNEEAGPADPTGAVGPNDIIQADNNNFTVYNKISGTVEEQMSLDQFWLAAWGQEAEDGNGHGVLDVMMNAYEPQVVFDAASGRWYVTALDDSNPPYTPASGTTPLFAANDVLLAVSKDSNPADGWVQFVIPADEDLYLLNPDPLGIDPNVPQQRALRADSDTIGFNDSLNATAVVITANLYDAGSGESQVANDGAAAHSGDLVSTMVLTIPKEDLLSASVTNDPTVLDNYTSVSEGAWTYGINPQAVVTSDANGTSLVLAQAASQTTGALNASALELTTIIASGTSFGISGTPVSIPLPVTYSVPTSAPQPNNAPPIAVSTEGPPTSQPLGVSQNSALAAGLVDDGIDQRLSNVVEVNGDLWTTQTVLNPATNKDAIAWWEISLASDTVIQHNLISDPNLYFYFPSIAVNKAGDVVIGFNGSDSTQFISSYAAVGTTFNGVTTFQAPQLVKTGTGVYTGVDSGIEPGPIGPIATPPAPGSYGGGVIPPEPQRGGLNESLWGAYSATALDPSNPNDFWTFQSITNAQSSSDTESWSVQSTRITIDQPAVTLSVSAPATVATPLKFGVMGDSLSAGDVTGTTPGWVAQLTASGYATVPVGANQAVDGALAAGLASQLPEIETLAPSLNYTSIIIGGNDALALAEGTETATQYTSTIESNIENAISTLQTDAPSDHLILGTVPDIFVTPLVEGLKLSAATIATDEAVIQGANAAITAYAVERGIPVIDLYAATVGLLGSGSLSVGGVTYTTTSTTDPLFAPDGFHPSAIVQGLIANMEIDAADAGYAAGLTPITDQQLVTNAGGTTAAVTYPTFFNLAPYVLGTDTNPAVDSETITATLSQPSAHDVVVNLFYSGSVQGSDYLTSSQQIVILAGQTSGSVTLTGLGEPTTIVEVGVKSLEGAVENTPQLVTAVLTNPPSIVQLSASPSSFAPGSGDAVVTATLSAPSATPTVINLTYTEPGASGAVTPATSPTINQFAVANSEQVIGATSGPNGDIWFTAANSSNATEIGAINPATGAAVQTFTENGTVPMGITEGPDGNLWFLAQTGASSYAVGKMTPTGTVTLYPVTGAVFNYDDSIVTGPDGNLWFTDLGNNAIGKITTSGVVTEYKVATAGAGLTGIVVGPDGNLWFAENNLGDVGRITTAGTITQFPTTGVANADPDEIIVGPNGNLWFTEFGPTSQGIGEMTTSGTYTNFPLSNITFEGATFAPGPSGLALGSDGNIYFSDGNSTTTTNGTAPPYLGIGEITPTGTVTQYVQSASAASFAPTMFVGPDNNIWFPIDGQAAVGQLIVASNSGGGGGGTGGGGGGGTATVPSDIVVSSLTIVIPAGQLSGSVTISGNGADITTPEPIDVTMTGVNGAYSQVPQEVTVTQLPSPPTGASISGTVVENATGNPGMAGVTVYLEENGSTTFNPAVDPFTTTNASGAFSFTGLNPGTYTVLEVVPTGFTETAPTGGSTTLTLSAGQQATNVAFVNTPPVISTTIGLTATNLSGTTLTSPTFNENNGQIEIVATLPQALTNNVLITLAFSGTAVEGTDYLASSQSILILAGQTSGSITLTGLPLAIDKSTNPTVTVSIASVMNANPSNASVTATIIEQNDVLQGVLSGSVFQDNNYNGVQNPGEPNLANALIYIDTNGTGVFNPSNDPFTFSGQSGSTIGLGDFAFDGLVAGSYNVYQVAPAKTSQTAPPNTLSNLTYYQNVATNSTLGSELIFGDAPLTNPNLTLGLSTTSIASNGGKATLTVTLGQTTPVAVTAMIKVSGSAPFADYSLVGPSGTVPLTLSNGGTFTVTFPVGQTSASYTITANQDSSATLETVTFDVVSVTNATTNGTSEVELAITPASGGSSALIVDNPSQASGTTGPGLSFSSTPTYDTAGDQPNFITQANLTGNGVSDFIVCNGGTTTISVILNPTSANPTVTTYNVGATPTGVVAADFTGSGVLDLAVSTANGITILMGNGSGGFTMGSNYSAGTSPSAIAAGDFNGDGKMDLAVANSGSNNVSIFYGNGNGTFQTPVNIAVGSDPVDIKSADLIGNGHMDLVVANHGVGDNTVSVLINNGSGSFTQYKYTAGIQPNSIAIADFNGDGHLDIAVANVGFNPTQSGMINTVSILFGIGNGTFTYVNIPVSGQPLPANTYAAGPSVWSIAAGDVNGDGHPDIVVTNNAIGSNEITVLLNTGGGTFQAPVALSVGTNPIPVSVVTGDFYGNGSIDIAAATDWGTGGVDGVSILQNQTVYNSLAFHVYLGKASTSTVTVKYTTANGTGVAGTDYLPVSGTLTFAPGQTEETVYVPVLSSAGANKTVILQLSSASGAPILIGTGVGTINPAAPSAIQATVTKSGSTLSISDPSQQDTIKINRLASGVYEVVVDNEVIGIYTGISGQINATTANGQDSFVVDEEVTSSGVITDPAMSNSSDDDFVFAELANGASWTIDM